MNSIRLRQFGVLFAFVLVIGCNRSAKVPLNPFLVDETARTYDFELKCKGSSLGFGLNEATKAALGANGESHLSVQGNVTFSTSPNANAIRMKISELRVKIDVNGVSQEFAEKEIESELRSEIDLFFWHGSLFAIAASTDLSRATRSLVSTWIAPLSIRKDFREPNSNQYSQETATIGAYQSTFRREKNIIKKELFPVSVARQFAKGSRSKAIAPAVNGNVEFVLESDVGDLKSVSATYSYSLSFSTGQKLDTEVMCRMKFLQCEKQRTALVPITTGSRELTYSAFLEEGRIERLKSVLSNTDEKALLKKWESVITIDPASRSKMIGQLIALFILKPDLLEAFAKTVNYSQCNVMQIDIFLSALAETSSNTSNNILLGIAKDSRLNSLTRRLSLSSLAFSDDVSNHVIDETMALAKEVKDLQIKEAAMLTLGSLIGRAKSVEGAQPAFEWLITLLRTRDPLSGLALRALSNTRSQKAFAVLSEVVASDDPRLRAEALLSMRLLEADEVNPVLAKACIEDEDASVRSAALSSMTFRVTDDLLWEASTYCLHNDKEEEVRQNALEVIINSGYDTNKVQMEVERASTQDPSPGIRKVAKEALSKVSR